jgi:hypothetical protein
MRRVLAVLTGALVLAACGDRSDPSGPAMAADLAPGDLSASMYAGFGEAASATYEVTITNLTSGQPFTPPLAATHRRPVSLFTVGEAASFGLKEIAENGNLAPLHMHLGDERHVTDLAIAAGSPPPLMPGASISFQLTVERGAKYLSFVSMLICTNDGFTGVDGLRLPERTGETVTVHTAAYDAGTEINTEDFADMVPPCPALTGVPSSDPGTGASDPALAEGGVIHHHPGIQGVADLSVPIHGWTDPVATVSVERTH